MGLFKIVNVLGALEGWKISRLFLAVDEDRIRLGYKMHIVQWETLKSKSAPDSETGLMEVEVEAVQKWMVLIENFLGEYLWLTNAYILDYFVESHWEKLAKTWREFLPTMTRQSLSHFVGLDVNDTHRETSDNMTGHVREGRRLKVAPLSLLAFRAVTKLLSLDRHSEEEQECFGSISGERKEERSCVGKNKNPGVGWMLNKKQEKISNLFNRKVKLKKRHEIDRMSKAVMTLCRETGTTRVVDVGGGVGHLSRHLAYCCGLRVTCIDCEEAFSATAGEINGKMEKSLSKLLRRGRDEMGMLCEDKDLVKDLAPRQICLKLEMSKDEEYLKNFGEDFSLIGLHTCGNLAPVILHNFVRCGAKFLISVGCCYMKMDERGFPLSKYLQKTTLKLTYEALEVACHAAEKYCGKLRSMESPEFLKTHCYRAALETVLAKRGIVKAGLKSCSAENYATFQGYAEDAVSRLSISLEPSELQSPLVTQMLEDWFKVVIFYSLRLMMAPVIETLVLLDRSLFIKEELGDSCSVRIGCIFKPEISPRNFAIIASRLS